MKVEIQKWSRGKKEDLIRICNEADRTFLSNQLPYPYTESAAGWWLGMVSEHDGKDDIFLAVVADGKIVGNILLNRKQMITAKTGISDTSAGLLVEGDHDRSC